MNQIFATISPGLSDGFRVDINGRIWTSAGDGVHCYAPDGELIRKIRFPEVVSKLTFSGPKGNRPFVTTASCFYSVFVGQRGVKKP